MDKRRLNTGEVLAAGILAIQPPKTDIPEDREVFDAEGEDWSFIGEDAVIEAIEKGMVVKALNYYGIPHVWKQGQEEYRAILLQCRRITENHTFKTVKEAAEWIAETYYETVG